MLKRLPLACLVALGCDSSPVPPVDPCPLDPSADGVSVASTVLPGTEVIVRGAGFGPQCGEARMYFRGAFAGRPVDFEVTPSAGSSATEVRYEAGPELFAGLGGSSGSFAGEVGARMRLAGAADTEAGLLVSFATAPELTPTLDSAAPESVTLNALVTISGDGFLAGAEGTTTATLDGTFTPDSGGARPVAGVRLDTAPLEEHDRTRSTFPFAPAVAGIYPGTFDGTVSAENVHASGATTSAPPISARFRLGDSFVTSVRPADPTLGAIVTVEGAGFIGGAGDQTLTLRLEGTSTPFGGAPAPVDDLEIVPAFVDGGHVAYTVIPVASGGTLVAADFGFARGAFSGTVTPVLRYRADRYDGRPMPFDLELGPVRQVVLVVFLPGFTDALRTFGLRAVDREVRAQVLDKFRRTFAGSNVDVRDEWPADYYPGGYAVVEVGGPDPNGRGLFGYDNTPGKDVGNLRLHDRIGGTNAEVQEDGYPGFGGVFIESFLCWSRRPPTGVECPDGTTEPEFDRVFDPVRSREVVAGEYPTGPDPARTAAIGEAIRVLGNVTGDTLAHEFGHSVGLAHPWGPPDLVHNEPPADGCLMDAGGYRPFAERAELGGARPGGFCGEERAYLDTVLPRD